MRSILGQVVLAALLMASVASAADSQVAYDAQLQAELECGGRQTRGILHVPSTHQLICVSIEGLMTAVDTKTAQRMWQVDLRSELEGAILGHIWTPAGPDDEVYALAVSPSGDHIAVVSRLGVAAIHTSVDGKLVRNLQRSEDEACGIDFMAVVFTPDGRHVVAGGLGRQLCQWNAESGALVRRYLQAQGLLFTIGFSEDQKILYAVSAQGIILWNTTTGEVIRRMEPPRPTPFADVPTITAASVSKDGRYLGLGTITGYGDEARHYWQVVNLETGQPFRTREAASTIYDVRFASDGRSLRVFSFATGWTNYDVVTDQVTATARSHLEDGYFGSPWTSFVWYGQVAWPWPASDDFSSAYSMDAEGRVRLWSFVAQP